jgi:hypothetical protein
MEQVHAEFTQHIVATQDTECERPTCEDAIIPAGQNRFYVKPLKGDLTIPGRWVCKKGFIHYRSQKNTVIKTATRTTASTQQLAGALPNVKAICQNVNESQ